jgi:hypothetical protein
MYVFIKLTIFNIYRPKPAVRTSASRAVRAFVFFYNNIYRVALAFVSFRALIFACALVFCSLLLALCVPLFSVRTLMSLALLSPSSFRALCFLRCSSFCSAFISPFVYRFIRAFLLFACSRLCFLRCLNLIPPLSAPRRRFYGLRSKVGNPRSCYTCGLLRFVQDWPLSVADL